jgi:hypothetical protein
MYYFSSTAIIIALKIQILMKAPLLFAVIHFLNQRLLKSPLLVGCVVYAYNSSTWGVDAGGFVSLRPTRAS